MCAQAQLSKTLEAEMAASREMKRQLENDRALLEKRISEHDHKESELKEALEKADVEKKVLRAGVNGAEADKLVDEFKKSASKEVQGMAQKLKDAEAELTVLKSQLDYAIRLNRYDVCESLFVSVYVFLCDAHLFRL